MPDYSGGFPRRFLFLILAATILGIPAGAWTATPTVRLADMSVDVLSQVGTSTATDDIIPTIQGGAHDPQKRGFNITNIEFSFLGAVDPYFTLETHLIVLLSPEGETEVELEEAFFKTTSLPAGFQLKGGLFFTEFGRINPRHPHQWHWIDQPVILSRVFGGDGMRAPGLRAAWLSPLPWYSEMTYGVSNAVGETMVSFLGEGEHPYERSTEERSVHSLADVVYLARWDNSWSFSPTVTAKLGFSGLFGPNPSGPRAETRIYGADFLLKWRPLSTRKGWPFVFVEGEYLQRDYESPEAELLPSATFRDHGGYLEVGWGFTHRWVLGLRGEIADGSGGTLEEEEIRDENPLGDRRSRLSPILTFHPSEFCRLMLQYNYDRAGHLLGTDPSHPDSRTAHSIWLGTEFLIGAHPVHTY